MKKSIKNRNYDKELNEWLNGQRLADSAGIVGWADKNKKIAIHDGVLRYDQTVLTKSAQNQEEQKI